MRALVPSVILLVVSPAIASPFPAPPAVPADLSLDYSALVLDQARGTNDDKKLALCPYERAACEATCAAGSQLACTRLGIVLVREKKPDEAKKVLQAACAKKAWSACIELANL